MSASLPGGGGAIGGPTAALVLRDPGRVVDVFECSGAALQARGDGIALHGDPSLRPGPCRPGQ